MWGEYLQRYLPLHELVRSMTVRCAEPPPGLLRSTFCDQLLVKVADAPGSRSESEHMRPLDTASAPAVPQQPVKKTRRRRNRPEPAIPLGSLTQVSRRNAPRCVACGTTRVTSLALKLTDGTPVQFVSCHKCEHRRWETADTELSTEDVLERTRRTK